MKRLLLGFLVLFSGMALVADPISLVDFSGGLNTSTNWTLVKSNQAKQVLNWTLDDPIGALTVRPGYERITADTFATKYGEYVSLHSRRFEDGKSFLDGIVTLPDSGYATIFRSPANQHSPVSGSAIGNLFYPTAGCWLTFRGNDYFLNGRNRMQIVTNPQTECHAIPVFPLAPGQPDARPLALSGHLNGIYMYSILSEIPCSLLAVTAPAWSRRPSSLSMPVTARNERIDLSNFWPVQADTGCPKPDDSVHLWYKILRTRGDHNDFSTDSLFVIDSIYTTQGNAATICFHDTTGDIALTSGRYWGRILNYDTMRFWWQRGHRNVAYAAGQPTMIYADSFVGGAGNYPDTILNEHKCGWISLDAIYFYTLADRFTGVEGDSSPILNVAVDGAAVDKTFWLHIPNPPSSRYYRVVYRAIYGLGHYDEPFSTYDKDAGYHAQQFFVLDTLKDSSVSEYVDRKPACSTEVISKVYNRRVPITQYQGAIAHEGRIFAWDDDAVYESVPDTALFPIENEFEFESSDGQRVVGLSSFEGFVLVYMTNATWILYTKDGVVYDQRKISSGFGAVSQRAIASYAGRQIVLGPLGVVEETGNPYRDNDIQRQFLSDPIKNLLVRDPAVMASTVAATHGDRILLSYPGTDSTFVLFAKTGGWGVWSFDFSAVCLYNCDTIPGLSPVDQLVFARPGDKCLYALSDTIYFDSASAKTYSAVWEKTDLSASDLPQTIQEVTAWFSSSVDDSIGVQYLLTSENGDTLAVGSVTELRTKFHRKRLIAQGNRVAHSFSLKVIAPAHRKITINGLSLKAEPGGTD